MSRELWCARLGQVPYEEARALQRGLEAARQAGEVPDVLLLLEHPPVYTKGRRAEAAELPMGEDWYRLQGIEVADADRGGRVTYHGPGQLVGYPIVSLQPYGGDVRAYVAGLERVMIDSLTEAGIAARTIAGLTGVWAGAVGSPDPAAAVASGELRKIGSIGVHVRRGVTTHGFAVNVNNDLQPFEWVVPCGIAGCRMTSVCRELGAERSLAEFMDVVAAGFGRVYGRDPAAVSAERVRAGADGRAAVS